MNKIKTKPFKTAKNYVPNEVTVSECNGVRCWASVSNARAHANRLARLYEPKKYVVAGCTECFGFHVKEVKPVWETVEVEDERQAF